MKKIISMSFYLIVLLWLTINILSIMNLSLFGYRIYMVGSQSMLPSLRTNDLIMVKKKSKYNVGDVVTYKDGDNYITHRIVSIENDKITTKGDNNDTEDKSIQSSDIVGKVVYKFIVISLIRFMLDKPISWLVVFILSILIILLIPVKIEEDENEQHIKVS